MDIIDQAQQQEQWLREQALARVRNQNAGPSASHCDECGAVISSARRKAVAGVRLCVVCQQQQEARYGR